MSGKNQHVVKKDDGWAVRGEGNKKISSLHKTQEEATARAREIAIKERSELIVHNKDGEIRKRNSYGNDPHPPKG